jgi:hypothetical protein
MLTLESMDVLRSKAHKSLMLTLESADVDRATLESADAIRANASKSASGMDEPGRKPGVGEVKEEGESPSPMGSSAAAGGTCGGRSGGGGWSKDPRMS